LHFGFSLDAGRAKPVTLGNDVQAGIQTASESVEIRTMPTGQSVPVDVKCRFASITQHEHVFVTGRTTFVAGARLREHERRVLRNSLLFGFDFNNVDAHATFASGILARPLVQDLSEASFAERTGVGDLQETGGSRTKAAVSAEK
jgi:hypothetical protein